jgi:hypothetical protein
VRCRQPEKILLPPELAVLLAEPVEIGPLLASGPLGFGDGLPAIDTDLPYPASEAAGRQAKAVGQGIAGEALLKTELN